MYIVFLSRNGDGGVIEIHDANFHAKMNDLSKHRCGLLGCQQSQTASEMQSLAHATRNAIHNASTKQYSIYLTHNWTFKESAIDAVIAEWEMQAKEIRRRMEPAYTPPAWAERGGE